MASVTFVGGVEESNHAVVPRFESWMKPVESLYCVIVLYCGEVPKCEMKFWTADATGALPAVQLGPQKIATTLALWITGPPWLITFWAEPPPPGFAQPLMWKTPCSGLRSLMC